MREILKKFLEKTRGGVNSKKIEELEQEILDLDQQLSDALIGDSRKKKKQ